MLFGLVHRKYTMIIVGCKSKKMKKVIHYQQKAAVRARKLSPREGGEYRRIERDGIGADFRRYQKRLGA
jgi:hypothetical protein